MRFSRLPPLFTTCFVWLALVGAASAEPNAYLHIKGQKSGDVKGSATARGREGSMAVIAVSHEIVSPRDPASGLPTGKRMHKPLVITKEMDKSSVVLRTMLVTNENIPTLTLDFYRATDEKYLTIKLTNANISSISQRMMNNKNSDLAALLMYEEIAFTYQKIEWTWTDGGIVGGDDWVTAQ